MAYYQAHSQPRPPHLLHSHSQSYSHPPPSVPHSHSRTYQAAQGYRPEPQQQQDYQHPQQSHYSQQQQYDYSMYADTGGQQQVYAQEYAYTSTPGQEGYGSYGGQGSQQSYEGYEGYYSDPQQQPQQTPSYQPYASPYPSHQQQQEYQSDPSYPQYALASHPPPSQPAQPVYQPPQPPYAQQQPMISQQPSVPRPAPLQGQHQRAFSQPISPPRTSPPSHQPSYGPPPSLSQMLPSSSYSLPPHLQQAHSLPHPPQPQPPAQQTYPPLLTQPPMPRPPPAPSPSRRPLPQPTPATRPPPLPAPQAPWSQQTYPAPYPPAVSPGPPPIESPRAAYPAGWASPERGVLSGSRSLPSAPAHAREHERARSRDEGLRASESMPANNSNRSKSAQGGSSKYESWRRQQEEHSPELDAIWASSSSGPAARTEEPATPPPAGEQLREAEMASPRASLAMQLGRDPYASPTRTGASHVSHASGIGGKPSPARNKHSPTTPTKDPLASSTSSRPDSLSKGRAAGLLPRVEPDGRPSPPAIVKGKDGRFGLAALRETKGREQREQRERDGSPTKPAPFRRPEQQQQERAYDIPLPPSPSKPSSGGSSSFGIGSARPPPVPVGGFPPPPPHPTRRGGSPARPAMSTFPSSSSAGSAGSGGGWTTSPTEGRAPVWPPQSPNPPNGYPRPHSSSAFNTRPPPPQPSNAGQQPPPPRPTLQQRSSSSSPVKHTRELWEKMDERHQKAVEARYGPVPRSPRRGWSSSSDVGGSGEQQGQQQTPTQGQGQWGSTPRQGNWTPSQGQGQWAPNADGQGQWMPSADGDVFGPSGTGMSPPQQQPPQPQQQQGNCFPPQQPQAQAQTSWQPSQPFSPQQPQQPQPQSRPMSFPSSSCPNPTSFPSSNTFPTSSAASAAHPSPQIPVQAPVPVSSTGLQLDSSVLRALATPNSGGGAPLPPPRRSGTTPSVGSSGLPGHSRSGSVGNVPLPSTTPAPAPGRRPLPMPVPRRTQEDKENRAPAGMSAPVVQNVGAGSGVNGKMPAESKTPAVPVINLPEEPVKVDPPKSVKVPAISLPDEPAKADVPTINVPTINVPSIRLPDDPPAINISDDDSLPPPPQITVTTSPSINITSFTGPDASSPSLTSSGSDSSVGNGKGSGSRQRKGLFCAGCGGGITGRIVSAMDKRWHPACFKCETCGELLEHVSAFEHGGKAYCHLDYHEHFAPRCYHCETPIADSQFITLDDPSLPGGPRTYHELHFFCAECGDPFLDPSKSCGAPRTANAPNAKADEEDEVGFTIWKGHPYCEHCHVRLHLPKCKGCKKPIREAEPAVEVKRGKWHWSCFVCETCKKPFADGTFFERQDKSFCDGCYRILLRNEI